MSEFKCLWHYFFKVVSLRIEIPLGIFQSIWITTMKPLKNKRPWNDMILLNFHKQASPDCCFSLEHWTITAQCNGTAVQKMPCNECSSNHFITTQGRHLLVCDYIHVHIHVCVCPCMPKFKLTLPRLSKGKTLYFD